MGYYWIGKQLLEDIEGSRFRDSQNPSNLGRRSSIRSYVYKQKEEDIFKGLVPRVSGFQKNGCNSEKGKVGKQEKLAEKW